MIVHLNSGNLAVGALNASESELRKALLVYTGFFNSMDGEVQITDDHLKRLVENHNARLDKLGDVATMKDYPPIQLDHSTSARDTVGRLFGKVSLGEFDGKLAIYGDVKILGLDNKEHVADGRWTHLSIGADLDAGEIHELTITPFPAAKKASLLKEGEVSSREDFSQWLEQLKQKCPDVDASNAELKELFENGVPVDEACLKIRKNFHLAQGERMGKMEELRKLAGELCKMEDGEDFKKKFSEFKKFAEEDVEDTELSESVKELRKKLSDVDMADAEMASEFRKHLSRFAEPEEGESEKHEDGESEETEKEEHKELKSRMSAFNSGASKIRLALKQAQIKSHISRLRADAKITPAEIKKMDFVKLAASSDEVVKAVLSSYEAREPVIIPGLYGTTKALSASDLAAQLKQTNLVEIEKETRARFTSLGKKGAKLAEQPVPPQPIMQPPAQPTPAPGAANNPGAMPGGVDHNKLFAEMCGYIRAGNEDMAKRLFAECVGGQTETFEGLDATQMSSILDEITKLEESHTHVIQLATKKLGIKL